MLDEGHDYGGPSASFMAQPQTSAVVDFVRGRSSSTTAIRRPAKSTVRDDDDTQSQQLTFQFGKSKEFEKLDPETILKIKMRYKDVSKYVIWPECAFPHDYNHGYLTFNPDKSKRTAIRYSHAGNHQAAVLRLNAVKWDDVDIRRKLLNGEIDASAFIRPAGSKGGKSKFYHQSLSLSRVPDLASVAEEQRITDSVSEENANKRMANIEDDRTPAPPSTINSVRRSESSDEEESIIGITARSDNVFLGDEEGPDIQVLRL
uniref:ULP_PROTEASE domain-containing protein n=1 Tax=Ascaris lumbricoides TaxID=6252 RepID=A0A0M3HX23_ASCLU